MTRTAPAHRARWLSRPARRRAPRRTVAGVFLLEALIVVVLCAIGLLGLMSLQSRSVQGAVGAEDAVRAALLASELASEMWAAGTVQLPPGRLADWTDRVADAHAGGLPEGRGEVTIDGEIARLDVSWQPSRQPDGTRHRYTTHVLVP